MDKRQWKTELRAAAEAAAQGGRLLITARNASGEARGTYAADAVECFKRAAKLAGDAVKTAATTGPAPAPKAAPKATPAAKPKKAASKAKKPAKGKK